jgi:uncharacterized protein (TIGR04255 family)
VKQWQGNLLGLGTNMDLKYDNLPLFEVAIRFSLTPPLPFSTLFVHDLLDVLKDEAQAIEDVQAEIPPGLTGTITPTAIRLVGLDLGRSITLHPNLIAVRWVGKTSKTYPGFASLRATLVMVADKIAELLGEPPSIAVANMFGSRRLPGRPTDAMGPA